MPQGERARVASLDDIVQRVRCETKNARAVCIRESQD